VPLPNLPSVAENDREPAAILAVFSMAGRAAEEASTETRMPATKRAAPAREAVRRAARADILYTW